MYTCAHEYLLLYSAKSLSHLLPKSISNMNSLVKKNRVLYMIYIKKIKNLCSKDIS